MADHFDFELKMIEGGTSATTRAIYSNLMPGRRISLTGKLLAADNYIFHGR